MKKNFFYTYVILNAIILASFRCVLIIIFLGGEGKHGEAAPITLQGTLPIIVMTKCVLLNKCWVGEVGGWLVQNHSPSITLGLWIISIGWWVLGLVDFQGFLSFANPIFFYIYVHTYTFNP